MYAPLNLKPTAAILLGTVTVSILFLTLILPRLTTQAQSGTIRPSTGTQTPSLAPNYRTLAPSPLLASTTLSPLPTLTFPAKALSAPLPFLSRKTESGLTPEKMSEMVKPVELLAPKEITGFQVIIGTISIDELNMRLKSDKGNFYYVACYFGYDSVNSLQTFRNQLELIRNSNDAFPITFVEVGDEAFISTEGTYLASMVYRGTHCNIRGKWFYELDITPFVPLTEDELIGILKGLEAWFAKV